MIITLGFVSYYSVLLPCAIYCVFSSRESLQYGVVGDNVMPKKFRNCQILNELVLLLYIAYDCYKMGEIQINTYAPPMQSVTC